MPFHGLLHREKTRLSPEGEIQSTASLTPEITFMRSDTITQEIITPPSFTDALGPSENQTTKRQSIFRRKSSAPNVSTPETEQKKGNEHGERRLSQRFGLRGHGRNSSTSSANIPPDLPNITDINDEDQEAQWETRATILARGGPSRSNSPPIKESPALGPDKTSSLRNRGGSVSSSMGDENIQEAIRLHEAGDLVRSTAMFGRLADPNGANNALSQVLYGLALRHGWGCPPDAEKGVKYLSAAAKNSAAIEEAALRAGMKKGGAAKGELVLAIFELANCFRYGWGVSKDPIAAKQYYETAANLGDTDAMNEVAWCYLEGFGVKKDKTKAKLPGLKQFSAAKYYRLAENSGNKTMGNSWIWKEKYSPS
ncbi:MAG: hypothetical protein M1829_002433 [Trizodia sp. TS-e1964]|nr:MAG: hypothetical protein M1829_002433 [Trizodia sp. TS-e1964]